MASRIITCDAIDSLYRHEHFRRSNTTVSQNEIGSVLYLHGNPIALLEYPHKGARLFVCDGGWESSTTKERLNGLPGVSVHHAKKVFYLNDLEWNGNWALINRSHYQHWTYEHPGFVISNDKYRHAPNYRIR